MKSNSPSAHQRIPLGELLVQLGRITSAELEAALEYKKERGIKLGQALVALHLITQAELAESLRKQGTVHCIHLTEGMVDVQVAQELGEERSRRFQAVAINKIAGVVTVALEDPSEIYNVDAIGMELNCPVFAVHADPDRIFHCLERVFPPTAPASGDLLDELARQAPNSSPAAVCDAAPRASEPERAETDMNSPVANMVRALLDEALQHGATDIHLEPRRESLEVRFRIDGCLQPRIELPRSWVGPAVEHVKHLANLDVLERRLPQEGRAQLELERACVGVRIATAPSTWGEGCVIGVAESGRPLRALRSLGLSERQAADLESITSAGGGLVLASGPARHGKTTTLYALLQRLAPTSTKIVTLEDPVEHELDGATQISLNAKVGLDYARGLRSAMRQDPDALLVGSLEDEEIAEIALLAALGGRLVLSTTTATGATESIGRLVDMRVEPYLLADGVRALIAQRLVRRVCAKCRRETGADPIVLQRMELSDCSSGFFRGEGCDQCNGSGFRGRLGLFEVLVATPEFQDEVRLGAGADRLRAFARDHGVPSLRQDGIAKALAGETTLEEVYTATARG